MDTGDSSTKTRMRAVCIVFLLLFSWWPVSVLGNDSTRTVHVFVALCDNENQGIFPVPARLGNGDDADNNLYWGALYGVRTFFKKSTDWELLIRQQNPKEGVLERCVFKHKKSEVYMLADAYRGSEIKRAVVDFIESACRKNPESILKLDAANLPLRIGADADLVAYIGHNGLMDFRLTYPEAVGEKGPDAIILACVSKHFFAESMRRAKVNPLVWTTGLMAPEAYTLKSALDGWILHESPQEVRLRAAKAYQQHQDCSLKAALNLLVTGW